MKISVVNIKLSIIENLYNSLTDTFGALSAILISIILSPYLIYSKYFSNSDQDESGDSEIVENEWNTIFENKSIKINQSIIDECTFKLDSYPKIDGLKDLEFITIKPYSLEISYIEFHEGIYLTLISPINEEFCLYHISFKNLKLTLIHSSLNAIISDFTIYRAVNKINFDFIDYKNKLKQIVTIEK